MKIEFNNIEVLYKHASSYAFFLAGLYELLRLQGVDLSFLPNWTVLLLVTLGPALKLWKQHFRSDDVPASDSP